MQEKHVFQSPGQGLHVSQITIILLVSFPVPMPKNLCHNNTQIWIAASSMQQQQGKDYWCYKKMDPALTASPKRSLLSFS
jgi:hypothetical protein